MHKLNTQEHRSTGHGTNLVTMLNATNRKIVPHPPIGTISKATAAPAPQRQGLIGPLFAATAAANSLAKAAALKPVQTAPDTGAVRQHTVQSMRADPDFNADDPRHVHAAQLRASAGAHADLLTSIKAIHAAGPNSHGSNGPTPL